MNPTGEARRRRGTALRNRHPWLNTPLAITRSCIRILNLHKGSDDMPIICSLEVASLDDSPYYETLSYVWGDPNDTEPMTVNGVTFNATANLFDFLHCLRLPTADRCIWADAICIDQQNDKERSHQIGLMSKIYQQAKEAHVYFGPFCTTGTNSWHREMGHDKGYAIERQFTPEMWEEVTRLSARDLEYFLKEEGFRPLSRQEHRDFYQRCVDDIFQETLKILDKIAGTGEGEHLYEYPVFFFIDEEGGGRRHGLNTSWFTVMDCIRWLLTREWWTRVWTLQEAVLPHVDPIVHAPPYSFRLSRLLNGIHAMLHHNSQSCCKWFGYVILTEYRDSYKGCHYTQACSVIEQRRSLTSKRQQSLQPEEVTVPLADVVQSIRGRQATEIRDCWFGILGFLHPELQEEDSNSSNWTTAELFTKCSKLIFSGEGDLTRMSFARRQRHSQVSGLPSWALDLSVEFQEDEGDWNHWKLYNASANVEFVCVGETGEWSDLKDADLEVKAIRIGTVQACGGLIPLDAFNSGDTSSMILKLVEDWQELYRNHVQSADDSAFWRTIFMDRNLEIHWLHERIMSLHERRVDKIRLWWKQWKSTGRHHDLDADRKADNGSRGVFAYRELSLCVKMAKFFVTTQGVPGMGPRDMQPSDEVYALAGCRSLAVLRRGSRNGKDCLTFVGLCFVDGWMYGRATCGSPQWETLHLY